MDPLGKLERGKPIAVPAGARACLAVAHLLLRFWGCHMLKSIQSVSPENSADGSVWPRVIPHGVATDQENCQIARWVGLAQLGHIIEFRRMHSALVLAQEVFRRGPIHLQPMEKLGSHGSATF